MTTSHSSERSEATAREAVSRPGRRLDGRLPAAMLGLVGSVVLLFGVSLPWVSSYEGLVEQSGWGSRNGNILVVAAAISLVLAVALMAFATTTLRWLLALTGFAATGYAGYLLIQLYTVSDQADGTFLLRKESGLYVAAAGAAAVFATIFLPMPARDAALASAAGARPADPASVSAGSAGTRLLGAVHSPWRYPAAALALVAGLAHVPVTPEHLQEAPYIGVSFIVLTVVCFSLAAALVIVDSPIVWGALGVTCLLAVIAYVISRTVGLPLMADDIGNWLEGLGVVSVLTESGVVIAAVLSLGRVRPDSSSHRRLSSLPPQSVGIAMAGLLLSGLAAVAGPSLASVHTADGGSMSGMNMSGMNMSGTSRSSTATTDETSMTCSTAATCAGQLQMVGLSRVFGPGSPNALLPSNGQAVAPTETR